jgi:hypothetical protein
VQSSVRPVDAAGLQLLAGVGLTIDLAIARRDAFDVLRRIKPGETYLHNLSERGSAALRAAHKSIRICRNSFLLSAGLWSALTEEGEAGCSKAGNLIGQ